jgi:putative adenylate-forming enzyme
MHRFDDESNSLGRLTEELLKHNKWSREELHSQQQRSLRKALRYAVTHSSYYRDTIGHLVDTNASFDEFPILTKRELIRNFDRIVTDRRLTLHDLEIHLDGADPGGVLYDQYRVAATSGTTGERAVVVYDQLAWNTGIACSLRQISKNAGGLPLKTVGIGASSPIHVSNRIYEALRADQPDAPKLNLTMPVTEVVAALNCYRPDVIITYPSYIRVLIEEQRKGRLRLIPKAIYSVAETLAPEVCDLVHETWGIRVGNRYNSTESFASGAECEHFNGIHLPEDIVIYEPVDGDNRSVDENTYSSKLLITTLFNRALPLIRYEVSDIVKVTTAPCPCGRPFSRMTSIIGRREEFLKFPGKNGLEVSIHAGQLRSPLIRMPGLLQFQFGRSESGVQVKISARDPKQADKIAINVRHEVKAVLERNDIADASVSTVVMDTIPRSGTGEKERLVANNS